jgi:uncharacterized protein (TIGR01244 family)
MKPIRINDKLSIMGQPALADFPSFAAEGFAAIVNNRPDREEAGQPGSVAEENAAREAKLAYTHIPVGPSLSEADVRRFQAALAEAEGPVLAHCKGGARSLTLYVIGEVLDGRMKAGQLRAFGEAHGINLAGAQAWLAAHAPGR